MNTPSLCLFLLTYHGSVKDDGDVKWIIAPEYLFIYSNQSESFKVQPGLYSLYDRSGTRTKGAASVGNVNSGTLIASLYDHLNIVFRCYPSRST